MAVMKLGRGRRHGSGQTRTRVRGGVVVAPGARVEVIL